MEPDHKNQKTEDTTVQAETPKEPIEMKKTAIWKKIALCLCACLLLAAAIGAWILNDYQIEVTLNGEQETVHEFGDPYEDPGVQVRSHGLQIFGSLSSEDLQIQGQVDSAKLGSYEITYSVTKQLDLLFKTLTYQDSVKRTVHVVDTTPPELTLLTQEGHFTLPGHEYEEEGYQAADRCDGTLTDQVERWQDGDWLFYKVTDSSGNIALEKRQIIYSDPVAPEVVLKGNLEYIVLVGKRYKEPGFTATDNFDGDLTDLVTVTGTVNHKKMGTYPIEYTVTDNAGNVTTVIRNVIVRDYPELPTDLFPGQAQEPVKPEGKVIYLTFDDGPSKHTEYLLDVLKKYDVKATFFVLNKGRHDTIKRIAAEGHTLAMHGSSHTYKWIYSSEKAFFKDLKKIQDLIYELTGQKSTIVRFPGGSSNTASCFNPGVMTRLTKMLNAMDYRYFDWSVSSGDAGGADTIDEIYQNVINGVSKRKISVVLQHDTNIVSVLAVEKIIKWGLENGYQFLPLSNDSPICRHGLNN